MTKEDLDDITREKTLVDVYRYVTSRIWVRPIYLVTRAVVFVLLIVSGIVSGASAVDLGGRVREWSAFGFNFAATVLGILLAGFAIFSTIATTALVEPLAAFKEEKSNLSYLKYTAGHFMSVFIPYVLFLLLHGIVMLFGWYGGPFTKAVTWLGVISHVDIGRYSSVLMMAIVGTFFVHLLIVLQSFVFNVYAAFMFMARTKLELDSIEQQRASEQGRTGRSRFASVQPAQTSNDDDKSAIEAHQHAERRGKR
ncbi:hypothetical protein [Polyangium sp. 15x6]|uniref:hypothetical protein n=1 Tax=Polyangium sp. 15x6 TaxID=3042687 RepID=UPI00249B974D|nr:hypothetical protein [Polyangium sp. 15x6]MDI3291022.1 hypothetical protein [Polyangium sp. 15x6]